MRPVNLIPTEERAGERRPMRGGPIAYVVVGALAAALLGITMLVLTGNQVSDRKAEVVRLEDEKAVVEARANALDAYTQFHNVRAARVATVTSLAQSRFDWERVMRELALILPDDVWLTNLSASASPEASAGGDAGVSLRSEIAGPALELVGCGRGQESVAGFVQALEEIDGVTRVGVQSSALGTAGEGGSGGDSAVASTCQTRDFIAQFQMVVAFDAAPVPVVGSAVEAAPAAPASAAGEEAGEGEATEGDEQ